MLLVVLRLPTVHVGKAGLCHLLVKDLLPFLDREQYYEDIKFETRYWRFIKKPI